jgi:hypothetical protein
MVRWRGRGKRSASVHLWRYPMRSQRWSRDDGSATLGEIWAATAAMLLSWKSGFPSTEISVVKQAGPTFEYAFHSDNGLFGSEIRNFAAALKLSTEALQNFTPNAYHVLLVAPLDWNSHFQ